MAPMPTEKAYWEDGHRRRFEGTGATFARFGDRTSIVLPRTFFYPAAGGQLGDRGTLTIGGVTWTVTDTQIDDAGTIHHLVADRVESDVDDAPSGAHDPEHRAVVGEIDRTFRDDQRAHHTAQHMLSRAFVDVAGAETTSARLGTSVATIDLAVPSLADADVLRAETLTNDVVLSNVVVRTHFPSAAELLAMPLRRAPKVTENVRVVEVEGFDVSPCGGTHCKGTGEIGTVRIVGTERYKGGTRVSFVAARRAIEDSRSNHAIVASLAKTFSCGAHDLPNAVARLGRDGKDRAAALEAAQSELATFVAEAILRDRPPSPTGTTHIVLHRPGADVPTLRALAGRLTSRSDVVALCTGGPAETGEKPAVLQRGATADFDCGAFWKRTLAPAGAKGGGRADRAEGRFPASLETTGLF
ncbi:MAG: alanyl-tRNA editing protein [Polyangiaceae bacterium]